MTEYPPTIDARVPDAGLIARFRGDLARLCDVENVRLLVAVSGGGDSLALLLLGHAVLGERCLAATVDHGLRPASADEARFVAYICAARGIAHATLTDAMRDRVGHTANVSARARELRYRLLGAYAGAIGATAIATAHHADDQLETLAMRLNRGAGVAGLAGIRSRSGIVLRPLLGWRRAELAALVKASGIVAIDDPTNRDDRYDRARLRKALAAREVLDAEGAAQSAAALAEAEDALVWTTDQLAMRHCVFDTTGATLTGASALPPELCRRLVMRCLLQVDPAAEVRGSALTRLIDSLRNGTRTALGIVLCEAKSGNVWHFRKAPPRRGH